MKNVKLFVSQTYELYKRDFWILIAANVVGGLLLNVFFNLHGFIQFVVIATLGMKHMTFIRSSSIMPSVSSDFDRFSWKYYQGLPLSKKELVLSLMLTNLIVMAPLMLAVVCFFPQLSVVFEDDFSNLGIGFLIKVILCAIAFFAWTSLISVTQQIINPRKQYSRVSPKIQFFEVIRNLIFGAFGIIYSVVVISFLVSAFDINVPRLLEIPVTMFKYVFQSWILIPTAFALVVMSYFKLLEKWQNEKFGYIKHNWNAKRDVPLSVACLLAIVVPYYGLDVNVPRQYQGNELNVSVYNSDYKEIERLIKTGADINQPNEHGYNPLFVSVYESNYEMFKHLLNKGATISEKMRTKNGSNILHLAIISKNAGIFDYVVSLGLSPDVPVKNKFGNYPVHLAAKNCRTDMMDKLIEKKADLSRVNKEGKTALHLSMENRCFATTALLLDSGADPSIKDKNNKVALDYHPKSSDTNIAYYLNKRARTPASNK